MLLRAQHYWLKGALIAVLVSIFFFAIIEVPSTIQKSALLSTNNTDQFSLKAMLWSVVFILSVAIHALLFNLILSGDFENNACRILSCGEPKIIYHFFMVLIIYFALGAIIGWIYGKIKKSYYLS